MSKKLKPARSRGVMKRRVVGRMKRALRLIRKGGYVFVNKRSGETRHAKTRLKPRSSEARISLQQPIEKIASQIFALGRKSSARK